MRSRILYISRCSEDALLLSQMMQSLPLILDHAESLQQARERLRTQNYDEV